MSNGRVTMRTAKMVGDFDEVWGRLLEVCDAQTSLQIAPHIKRSAQAVYQAHRKKSIPNAWFAILMENYGVNQNYVLRGEYPKFLEKERMRIAKTKGIEYTPLPQEKNWGPENPGMVAMRMMGEGTTTLSPTTAPVAPESEEHKTEVDNKPTVLKDFSQLRVSFSEKLRLKREEVYMAEQKKMPKIIEDPKEVNAANQHWYVISAETGEIVNTGVLFAPQLRGDENTRIIKIDTEHFVGVDISKRKYVQDGTTYLVSIMDEITYRTYHMFTSRLNMNMAIVGTVVWEFKKY